MEAPIQSISITSKPSVNDYSKYIYSKNRNIKINNESYILKIGRDPNENNMAIFLEPLEPLLYKIYKNDFSLESLAKISKIFKFFDTIEEAINSLNEYFDSDNYSFNIENKKIINFPIYILLFIVMINIIYLIN